MKKIFLIFALFIFSINSFSHPKDFPRLTPEEFRAKQREFIIQKAELTQQEADAFFPLFFEMQDKKKEMNDKVWRLIKQGKNEDTTESQYDEIINSVIDLRIQINKLEQTYLKKFRKALSAKKVYKVQHAEMRFHRELLKNMNKDDQQRPKKKK